MKKCLIEMNYCNPISLTGLDSQVKNHKKFLEAPRKTQVSPIEKEHMSRKKFP